ncbi:hypothetical protein [Actinoplanes sp. NBRC 103695]|uniref:hypothetical protein n=1 Tax=Actinoplanes sp. NBRC 103695 TaxID=3032202 RepID=UPI0025562169|nr:hypothetical protein [Actinoplanes sp. NBRC 103695]
MTMQPSTVVSGQAWRRWVVVIVIVGVLCSVPIVLGLRPAPAATTADPATLRARMAASAGLAFQGYAQSSGLLPLPSLPNLTEITRPLSSRTEMRVWYADRDSWRVDVIDGATERDTYQYRGSQFIWDFGDTRLTQVIGEQPVRLPRPADLVPPDLVRRLLSLAAGDRAEPITGKRVAGIDAAGLRLRPVSPDTTIDHVDVWADPSSGLPVQAEVTAKGGERPVFTSRFLSVEMTRPDAKTITPPSLDDVQVTDAPDLLSQISARRRGGQLPATLGGEQRNTEVAGLTSAGTYGDGLAQFVVLRLPGRFGNEAYDRIATYGADVHLDGGHGAVLATGLLTILAVRAERIYLVAGFVQPAVLRRVAADLGRLER